MTRARTTPLGPTSHFGRETDGVPDNSGEGCDEGQCIGHGYDTVRVECKKFHRNRSKGLGLVNEQDVLFLSKMFQSES